MKILLCLLAAVGALAALCRRRPKCPCGTRATHAYTPHWPRLAKPLRVCADCYYEEIRIG